MKAFILLSLAFFCAACGSSSFESQSTYQNSSDEEVSPLMAGKRASLFQSLFSSSSDRVSNSASVESISRTNVYNGGVAPHSEQYQRTQETIVRSPDNESARPRLVSYSGQLTIKVDSINLALKTIKKLSVEHNGYVVNSSNTTIVIRVTSAHFEDAMSRIAELGSVEDRRVDGRDISDEFYDLETRLSNAESARKRYLELLAKSENVEAGLKVERELERLNGEIETMKARRERMNEMHQMALISVSLRETNPQKQSKPGPLGYVFVGLYQAVKWLFVWN